MLKSSLIHLRKNEFDFQRSRVQVQIFGVDFVEIEALLSQALDLGQELIQKVEAHFGVQFVEKADEVLALLGLACLTEKSTKSRTSEAMKAELLGESM